MYFALMLLWWLVHDLWKFFNKLLRPFSRLKPLMWSLCCQNVLNLSFRCFSQLLSPISRTLGETINITACIIILFIVVVLAISMSSLIDNKLLDWMFGAVNRRHSLMPLYISAALLRRVAFGFCFAYLSSQGMLLLVMLAFNGIFLLVLVSLRKAFLSKSMWTCALLKNVLRCLLQCILIVEYLTDGKEEDMFAALEMTMLIAIFCSTVLEFLCQLIDLQKKKPERKTMRQMTVVKKSQIVA